MSEDRPINVIILVGFALLAFAANSLLCRVALAEPSIDAASFTGIRLLAAALTLWLLLARRQSLLAIWQAGHWWAALALFAYAAAFSYAYIALATGTGALLLFAAVQLSMLGVALYQGDSISRGSWVGLSLAVSGVVYLLLPGLQAPPLGAALLMLLAGVAWGGYTLMGRGATQPLLMSGGNFLRTLPAVALLLLWAWPQVQWSLPGVLLAVVSGAVTSALGYAVWYQVLPQLSRLQAGVLQLAVPPLAALAGVLVLGELLTWRFLLASGLVVLWIGLTLRR